MNNFIGKRGSQLLVGGLMLVFAGLSHAQFVWINEKGVRQFSDRPPPANTPAKNILKAPGLMQGAATEAAPTAPAAGAAVAKSGPPTLADRETDYKKRQSEKAEADKKSTEDNEMKAAKKANCDSSRAFKQQLDSGQRLSTTDKNGERSYMDDAQRKEKQAQAARNLEGCND